MSVRPVARGGAVTGPRHADTDPQRLARVLAAGLAFGAKRERESTPQAPLEGPVAKRLQTELAGLPDDVVELVAEAMLADDPCREIGRVCQVSREFNNVCKSDAFWRLACELHDYDREDRTTGYHQMAWPSL